MPWKCPVCGYENADDANFCIRCGAQKPVDLQSSQTPPPPPVTMNPTQSTSPGQSAQTPPPPPPVTANPTPPSPDQSGQALPSPPVTITPQDQSAQQAPPPVTSNTPPPVTTTPAQQVVTAPPVTQPPLTQKFYLLFIQTPYAGLINQKVPLNLDIFPSISIGRSPENVIIVPDPEVSRRHAVITLEGGELYIEDLNSTNGTYIYDGKLFQPVKGKQKISPNTIIKLGNQTIVKIVAE
ncbi:FHA domain-containing protein [Sulfurisphaera javensis]|uniref:FHA domain-containing protein n=1 Tax=Sulfurisphaera javensis TaxID=2049879 RepID=A0AAT9GSU7_9CREN